MHRGQQVILVLVAVEFGQRIVDAPPDGAHVYPRRRVLLVEQVVIDAERLVPAALCLEDASPQVGHLGLVLEVLVVAFHPAQPGQGAIVVTVQSLHAQGADLGGIRQVVERVVAPHPVIRHHRLVVLLHRLVDLPQEELRPSAQCLVGHTPEALFEFGGCGLPTGLAHMQFALGQVQQRGPAGGHVIAGEALGQVRGGGFKRIAGNEGAG
jgi:hypothetical protein